MTAQHPKAGPQQPEPGRQRTLVSPERFEEIFNSCKNWGRWGADDERGALNFIGDAEIRAAAALVRRGRTVSCARPLDTIAGPDNPWPVIHHMTTLPDVDAGGSGDLRFSGDYLGIEFHGDAHSHIDALCHVVYKGLLYNGVPARHVIDSAGARTRSIRGAASGIVTRGVLLDLPALYGAAWLDPGHAITEGELRAAEDAAQLRLATGDVLFVRTGHTRRRREQGPWDVSTGKAGLHPEAMPMLHERQISVLACDTDSDIAPTVCPEVPYPVHAIGIAGLGLHFLDHLDLEALADQCATEGVWEFMCIIAPLAIKDGTGSPVNPIAVF
jgi:kynurenine formamidase